MKSNSCKNRNDIAGQSIEIEWHVCLGDTSLQMLQKLKAFMSEARHEPENIPNRIIFANMFNDITGWERPKVQAKYLVQAKYVAFLLQYSDLLLIGDPVVQDEKRSGNTWKNDHLTKFLTVDGTVSHFGE